jgi:hypothetical protein
MRGSRVRMITLNIISIYRAVMSALSFKDSTQKPKDWNCEKRYGADLGCYLFNNGL